ncbi:unnamed protein product [Ambrosiozyma monospora]|uniref:Unnamed protein product n=1 Tax=Ambrosiozyma monospora TaxID=43982 RepID=A0ACB5SRB8_AMBMO|nr:unnamed protein product [Ambrosiozyma monospora]
MPGDNTQMKEQIDTNEDEASNSISGATYRKTITSVEQAKQQLDTSGSQNKITTFCFLQECRLASESDVISLNTHLKQHHQCQSILSHHSKAAIIYPTSINIVPTRKYQPIINNISTPEFHNHISEIVITHNNKILPFILIYVPTYNNQKFQFLSELNQALKSIHEDRLIGGDFNSIQN